MDFTRRIDRNSPISDGKLHYPLEVRFRMSKLLNIDSLFGIESREMHGILTSISQTDTTCKSP